MDLNIFDSYNLRARFSVFALYALPFVVDITLIDWQTNIAIPTLLTGIMIFVICQSSLDLMRNFGSKTQNNNPAKELLKPTSSLSQITKQRYYRKLAALEPEFTLFSEICDSQAVDSNKVDMLCAAAVDYLRGKSRDSSCFPLLKEENINYGFIRNALALKWMGICCNIAAIVLLLQYFSFEWFVAATDLHFWLHIAVCIYLFTGVSYKRQDIAGIKYAYALLETIDVIYDNKF